MRLLLARVSLFLGMYSLADMFLWKPVAETEMARKNGLTERTIISVQLQDLN